MINQLIISYIKLDISHLAQCSPSNYMKTVCISLFNAGYIMSIMYAIYCVYI